ncbi:MAG TPA: hypothetical protein QGH10_21710 [Armatimonadota bacterium]|jgi:hypothetical protein|nr:hypothetical protein [Armatimonadota bacterium]
MARGKEKNLMTPAKRKKKRYAADQLRKKRRAAHRPRAPRVERPAEDKDEKKKER